MGLELAQRGHDVCVLTSPGPDRPVRTRVHDLEVRRLLHLEVDCGLLQSSLRLLGLRARREQDSLRQVRLAVAEFEPDAALIWGMWNVPRSVPAYVEHLLGQRVAYYLCDYWPTLPSAYLLQWQAPPRRTSSRILKSLLSRPFVAGLSAERPPPLRLEHPICVSRAVRDRLVAAGVPVEHARVVYGGTSLEDFSPRAWAATNAGQPLRLLYAGRLTPTKGVHTAMHALARLGQKDRSSVTFDVVGAGDEQYERELKGLVQTYGLESLVRFHRAVGREAMPRVFADHDVLLLLSEWEEPFARVVLEGMASEMAVIATTTGGTGEIVVDGQTGLTFPPGNADRLARQIRRLLEDPDLRQQLACGGRRCVEHGFTLGRMVDDLESALRKLGSTRA